MSMEDRKQMACEHIGSDEGFWGDYSNLDESVLEKYFAKAETKAEEIAEETSNIEDDDKSWDYIAFKIDDYKKELKKELDALL